MRFVIIMSLSLPATAFAQQQQTPAAIYAHTCASCHGPDGRGQPPSRVAFEEELPDFTDCSFASREPDGDWVGVAYEGGPTRGFSRMMPAFGEALSAEELGAAVEHIRTFCDERDAWPPGELNLPRPMFTEKAYPEDEAVLESAIGVGETGSVVNQLVYEQRVGTSGQIEIVVPFGWREQGVDGPWPGGIGDIALGAKQTVMFSDETGTIFSIAAEVKLPTGKKRQGFGKGMVVFEPFLAFGQLFPADFFLHAQGGAEITADTETDTELFWRGAFGKTFVVGDYGRAISPMIEVLGKRDLAREAETHWDLVPQFQVTLNTRQHVMANIAVRLPMEDDYAPTEVLVYLLWDWFDGGLTEGW